MFNKLYTTGNGFQFDRTFEKPTDGKPVGIFNVGFRPPDGAPFLSHAVFTEDGGPKTFSKPATEVIKFVETFLLPKTKESFNKYNLTYKTGVLLYGKQGTGKTVSVNHLAKRFRDDLDGAVILNCNPQNWPAVQHLRHVFPNVPVLAIFEEFEQLIYDYGERNLLSILDGQSSINNCVFLATTNYINKIPSRIRKRPSRFARVIEVTPPTLEEKLNYFKIRFSDIDNSFLTEIINGSENFTIDNCKAAALNYLCYGLSAVDSVKSASEMVPENKEEEEEEED